MPALPPDDWRRLTAMREQVERGRYEADAMPSERWARRVERMKAKEWEREREEKQ